MVVAKAGPNHGADIWRVTVFGSAPEQPPKRRSAVPKRGLTLRTKQFEKRGRIGESFEYALIRTSKREPTLSAESVHRI